MKSMRVGWVLCWVAAASYGVARPVAPEPQNPPLPTEAEFRKMPEPRVQGQSALIMDAASGRILWEQAGQEPRFPASTTKILTALLLIENTDPGDIITAPPEINTIGESSIHLKPGEQLTAADLLKAIMLRSANDACYAIAVHLAGSQPAFAEMMNRRARELGCSATHFVTPNGLHDPGHVSSARDLALMTREALEHEEFREVVRMPSATLERGPGPSDAFLRNRNSLLGKDPTIQGVKTGYTVPAGRCFVGLSVSEGREVITVILKSPDWKRDTQILAGWTHAHYVAQPLIGDWAEAKVPGLRWPLGGLLDADLPSSVLVRPGEAIESVRTTWSVPETFGPADRLGEVVIGFAGGEDLRYEIRSKVAGAGPALNLPEVKAARLGWLGYGGIGALLVATFVGLFGSIRRSGPHGRSRTSAQVHRPRRGHQSPKG